jgi:uncharacterized protein (TIGR02118 family)
MLKTIGAANMHPGRRSLAEFHNYWGESHGPLHSNTRPLRRYVQHLTLPESYAINRPPASTYDGCSMFWYDDLESFPDFSTPEQASLRAAVTSDDRQLFDRIVGWPTHAKRTSVIAEEKVILEGHTTPEMVKLLSIYARRPGLNLEEFFQHWYEVHGQIAAKLPGLRRYVQNHGLREAYATRAMTHDGFSEMWFDDLASLQRAVASPEWGALAQDGETLFAQPAGTVIARERIQKWEGRPLKDYGVPGLSENDIRDRLRREGFSGLAADPRAPGQIKDASAAGCLAVWTTEHIVTIDESHIDARPDGAAERLGL